MVKLVHYCIPSMYGDDLENSFDFQNTVIGFPALVCSECGTLAPLVELIRVLYMAETLAAYL